MSRGQVDILFVSHYYSESLVGTQRLKHLVSFLSGRGYNIEVLANSKSLDQRHFKSQVYNEILHSRAEMVFVSCGPFYYLWWAALAAWLGRKRLIVDFRDPWSLNIPLVHGPITRRWLRHRLARIKCEAIERFAYARATSFIVCTRGMMSRYAAFFGDGRKIRFVPNGYDFEPADYRKPGDRNNDDNRVEHFVCLGKFFEYSEKKAKDALDLAIRRKGQFCSEQVYLFLNEEGDQVKRYFAEIDPNASIRFRVSGRLPYDEAMKAASICDCGLLVIRNEAFDYGTKIYDYIGLGLPVLDTFDHDQEFYASFSQYLNPPNEALRRQQPDSRHNRNEIWSRNLDLFNPRNKS